MLCFLLVSVVAGGMVIGDGKRPELVPPMERQTVSGSYRGTNEPKNLLNRRRASQLNESASLGSSAGFWFLTSSLLSVNLSVQCG